MDVLCQAFARVSPSSDSVPAVAGRASPCCLNRDSAEFSPQPSLRFVQALDAYPAGPAFPVFHSQRKMRQRLCVLRSGKHFSIRPHGQFLCPRHRGCTHQYSARSRGPCRANSSRTPRASPFGLVGEVLQPCQLRGDDSGSRCVRWMRRRQLLTGSPQGSAVLRSSRLLCGCARPYRRVRVAAADAVATGAAC